MNHFSHPHELQLLEVPARQKLNCNACDQQILDTSYHGCRKCRYWLHNNCLNFPRSIQHPSHPSHPLALLPIPTYSSRSFFCNACASVGNNFTLSCAHCEFDLHLNCASLPNSLLVDKLHPHRLKLTFKVPSIAPNSVFKCDVCRSMMSRNQWFYYCQGCDFGSHLECAIPKPWNHKLEEAGIGETSNGGIPANNSAGEGSRRPNETRIPEVEAIRKLNELEEQICAAQIAARLKALGSQNALDLLDPPGTRYYYY
ncbi:hypothetical protein M9H77_33705 [Catharanthus roseus]|uniref:Uncharacterized protein n=1 Tax=Catharanthus roseus TaxID=4058 RepID=A0ACB9ZJW4_CATRO|nr:hypothetical protein M9H77_33705 [Catharanthus roseus]